MPETDQGGSRTAVPAGSRRRRFDASLRGYDRDQVDRYVTEVEAERARVGDELAELRSPRRELDAVRRRDVPVPPPVAAASPSAGIREVLLRAARGEALRIRADAARDAGAIRQAARTEADRARRDPR